jgi:hypothetical protein
MLRPKGPEASKLRQRKFRLLQTLRIPEDALPGSLALIHRRCGKPTCHCAKGEGHPVWVLTYTYQGKKHVEWIPEEWVEEIRARVEEGRAFQEAFREVLVTNAQLVVLARRQRRR